MIIIVLVCIIIITFMVIWSKKPKNFPPGPPRLPLVGSLPFLLEKDLQKTTLVRMASKMLDYYGKVCGFYIGNKCHVLLSDFDLIKQVLKSYEASDRPYTDLINEIRPVRNLGIVFSQGKAWSEQRLFVSRKLKDFGFGKSSMEPLLKHEVTKLVAYIQSYEGAPIPVNCTFNVSILNALWLLICGKSYELDDPKLLSIVNLVNRFVRDSAPVNPLVLLLPNPNWVNLPILKHLSGFDMMENMFSKMDQVFDPEIKGHLDNFEEGQENDLIDVLIRKVKETKDESSMFYGETGLLAIKSIMVDLFMAGTETTNNTLVWSFLYLLHYPHIQDKVHDEIERVVGSGRTVALDDRPKLHFVNAVIEETYRCSSLLPLNVPQSNAKPMQVGPYTVPENTCILTNLYFIMNDPEYWKDPEVFRPERFLDENGVFHHNERVIPFSVGKRICLGQTLAEMEFFLFFVGLIQAFKLKNVPGQILPSYRIEDDEGKGIARSAPIFDIIMEPRHDWSMH